MSDPINLTIDGMEAEKADQNQADQARSTMVNLNGRELSFDDAIKELQKLVTDNIEPFDNTRPRLVEPVPIHIGGRERHLRLPFWALRRFQKETGVSPWDHNTVWAIPADLDMTVALLWAALLDESPELTLDEVWMFEGLDFANIHYVRKCLDDCWGRNMPDPEKSSANGTESKDPNPSRRRTG